MTVAEFFRAQAARWADRPFLCVLPETAAAYGIAAGETTYGEAAAEVDRLAAECAGLSGRVWLELGNRPAFFLQWLALNAVGVSIVPLNPDLRPAERAFILEHSGAAAPPPLAGLSRSAARGRGEGWVHPATGQDACGTDPFPRPRPATGGGAECALLYTSGTTGRPKGCILTNDYVLRAGAWYAALGGSAALRPGVERLITPLPMHHMNALAFSTMAMVATGGCIVPLDRFHPRTWWDSVRRSRATIVHYLGVMPSMLLGLPPDQDRDHAVRFGFGAGVDRRHHALFEDRFGFPLLEAWAMTETGAGACIIAHQEPRHVGTSSFGRPAADTEIRLVDEHGAEAPDGTPGELLVRAAGPDRRAGFFAGYLHDPAATDAAWEGGWFHTGDVVQRGPGGDLVFVDRRKNVIRRSGENISAVEVESVLRRCPGVRDVAVTSVPDDVRGEEVLACIVPDGAADAGAIVRAALEELSYYKVPGWVAFVEALPVTSTQKVQRGELKALAARLLTEGRCLDSRALKRHRPVGADPSPRPPPTRGGGEAAALPPLVGGGRGEG